MADKNKKGPKKPESPQTKFKKQQNVRIQGRKGRGSGGGQFKEHPHAKSFDSGIKGTKKPPGQPTRLGENPSPGGSNPKSYGGKGGAVPKEAASDFATKRRANLPSEGLRFSAQHHGSIVYTDFLQKYQGRMAPEDLKEAATEAGRSRAREKGGTFEPPSEDLMYRPMTDEEQHENLYQKRIKGANGKVRVAKKGEKPASGEQQVAGPLRKPVRQEVRLPVEGNLRTPSDVISNMLTPDEQAFIEKESQRSGSPLYGAFGKVGQMAKREPGKAPPNSAAKRKLKQYTDLMQVGYTQDQAFEYVNKNHSGRPAGGLVSPHMRQLADEKLDKRQARTSQGRKPGADRYKTTSHQDFKYSVRVPGIQTMEQIRREHPQWSDAKVTEFRQAERESIYDLMANERWAHESRAERYDKNNTEAKVGGNRVVVFTTSAGGPTASVPSTSLLGQYVIKKRKKLAVDEHLTTRHEVKGEFPRAVRDLHIVEIGTGISLGVQGRYGLHQNTGWRKGSKRSKGYGKPLPVGAEILRDSHGQAVYDSEGNMRYTQGYTRPFSRGTDHEVGLRIFIG